MSYLNWKERSLVRHHLSITGWSGNHCQVAITEKDGQPQTEHVKVGWRERQAFEKAITAHEIIQAIIDPIQQLVAQASPNLTLELLEPLSKIEAANEQTNQDLHPVIRRPHSYLSLLYRDY